MRMNRLAAGLTAAFMLAGCANSDPLITGSIPPSTPQTIAFDSVDGPPKAVFDRLVAAISAEAETRQLPVISRSGAAAYRVRAYLATHVEKKKATLSWVWDVFDARLNHAFRLSGEEPLGPARKDVWAQCDDAALKRVVAKGFDALAARLGATPPSAPVLESEPAGYGPQVVSGGNPHTVAYTTTRP